MPKQNKIIKYLIQSQLTYIENLNLDNVDWEKTFIERTSIKYPTQEQISKYIVQSVKDYFGVKVEYTPTEGLKEVKSNFYVFVGNNRFDTIIKNMQSQIDAKVNELETKLSAELADKVERCFTVVKASKGTALLNRVHFFHQAPPTD